MKYINALATELNKPVAEVLNLLYAADTKIYYDHDIDEQYIHDDDYQEFIKDELEHPTRYNFRGPSCTEIQRIMLRNISDPMIAFWLGNVQKYLYRFQGNVGDLKKAKQYLEFVIKELEDENK